VGDAHPTFPFAWNDLASARACAGGRPRAEMSSGSGSTRWRQFAKWAAAGARDKARAQRLAALGERGLLNLRLAVLNSASARAAKGGGLRHLISNSERRLALHDRKG
jgi:hypothetical protein